MEMNKLKETFIFKFLRFYSVDEVKNILFYKNKIYGEAIWNDIPNQEDIQHFVWEVNLNDNEIIEIIEIIDYIYINNYFNNDKILIDDYSIKLYFIEKWDEEKINKIIEKIYDIEIEMIDENGQKNDAFYLHK